MSDLAALRNQLREEEIKLVNYHVQNDSLKANKAAKNASAGTAAGSAASLAAAKKKSGHSSFSAEELTEIQRAFDEFDTNRTNTICLGELMALSKRLGVEMSESKGKAALESLDTNKDGVLSFEEFLSWWGSETGLNATTTSTTSLLAVRSKLKARHLLEKFTRSLNITPDPNEEGMKAALTANIGGGGAIANNNTYINLSVIPTDSAVFYASAEAKEAPMFPALDDGSDDESSSLWASDSDSLADDDEAASAQKKLNAKREKGGLHMMAEVKVGLTSAARALSKETLQQECDIINGVVTSLNRAHQHLSISAKPSEDGAHIVICAYLYGSKFDKIAEGLAAANKKSGGAVSKADAILREATIDLEFNSDVSDSFQMENGAPISALLEGVTLSAMANAGPIVAMLFQMLPLKGRQPLLTALQQADMKLNFSNIDELKEFIILQVGKLPVGSFEEYTYSSDDEDGDEEEIAEKKAAHEKDVREVTALIRRRFQFLSSLTLGEMLCEKFKLFKGARMPKCTPEEAREWKNWEEPDESKWVTPSDNDDDDDDVSSVDSEDQAVMDATSAIEHFFSLLESVDELTVQHLNFVLSLTGKHFNVFNLLHASNRAIVYRANRLSLRRKFVKTLPKEEDVSELGDAVQKCMTIGPQDTRWLRIRTGMQCEMKIF